MTADQYATLIYYWHGEPHPEQVGEIIRALETTEWANGPGRALPVAGAVLALHARHPELDIPVVCKTMYKRALATVDVSPNNLAYWCDFHIAQWLILHDPVCLDKLLDRVADGGSIGWDASAKVNAFSIQCIPFAKAMEAAQVARRERMIVNPLQ